MRAVLFVALLALALPLAADFTVPPPHEWIVIPCENWNCAVAELVSAAGDPNVIAVPTTDADHPWIVLKLVLIGSYTPPEDPAWSIERFSLVGEAAARFASINKADCPVMLTTTSEGILIAARTSKRVRAVRH